ncbi:MAG TPA: ATP synthase subunit I [Steroidobacteraceae bacterium]|nr:ATP synthase subunit I [Steroidobacteraceae bacterium]
MVAIELADARRLAFGVVLGQVVATLIVACLCWLLAGWNSAVSALLGGGIAAAASLAMTVLAFGRWASGSAERLLAAFYVGELAKLVVVIALFTLVLTTLRPAPAAMLAAYGATFLVYWIVLAGFVPGLGGLRRLRGLRG